MEALLPTLLAEGARSNLRVLMSSNMLFPLACQIFIYSLPEMLHNQNQTQHFLHNLKLSEDAFTSVLIFC